MRYGVELAALLACVAPFACGSEERRMERGLTVDEQQAVPGSEREFEMTKVERR